MSFLAPTAWFFAAALPVVVLFYLLKRKRVVRRVPSTILWERFLAETQASAPLQRLRHNWLLLLQLLLLLLVILALSRPYQKNAALAGKLHVLVLDASASMQATDEAPTRFEKARSEALRLVDALDTKRGAQAVVLLAGGRAEVLQSATGDKGRLRAALNGAKATDSPTRLVSALRLAETFTRNDPESEVHLFSDGAIPGLDEFGTKDLRLTYHPVGKSGRNAGIVSAEARVHPEDPGKIAVFASVANHTGEAMSTSLELRLDGEWVATKAVTLGVTNLTPVVFVVDQAKDGVFSLSLEAKDELAVDNRAEVVSVLPRPVKVLLVSRGNRHLEKALMAAGPRVELKTATDYAGGAEATADVVVLDNVTPTVWPAGNVLAVRAAPETWFPGARKELETPAIVHWKSTHPLLRSVSFDQVPIAKAVGVAAPDWGVSVVETQQNPLIVAGDVGRQRVIWLAFDPLESLWPLRISFPIFIANAVEWLSPTAAHAMQLQIRPGDTLRWTLDEPVASVRVKGPGGGAREVSLAGGERELLYADTATQGVYELQLGERKVSIAAALLDAGETQIAPRAALVLGKRGEVAGTTQRRASLEYWRWIALGGLAVLMFEWWWYHRRTA